MNPDELIFHKIDDYLRGRLSPEDRAVFESDMAADLPLAALVRRQAQENQALEVLAERDLRVRMNAWERQMPATLTPAGGRHRRDWMRWAVAAMLVIAAGWWILQRPRGTAVEAPVAGQPEAPVGRPTTPPKSKPAPKPVPVPNRPERRPDTRPPQEVIADAPTPTPPAPAKRPTDYAALADEFYRERDFISPKRIGGGLAKEVIVKELLAHSLLKSRKYDAAITAFQEVVNTRKQPYADRAEWALALAYLHQMPRRNSALQQVLRNIKARPGHPFYGRAMALQGRLGG